MKTVVIGLLGSTLDRGEKTRRWDFWRPTVAVCQHEDLLVDRLELIHDHKFAKLAHTVTTDIHSVSPETEVITHIADIKNPWDFEEVYGHLYEFARDYDFDPDQEEYLINITTGTHVIQICEFLLAESRHFPAKLLQLSPPSRPNTQGPGQYAIIDLDLSKYDRIAMRYQQEISDDISFLKSGIETKNRQFNQLIERIEHVAGKSRDPILLMGPTGAGKSQLARRIFELKKNRHTLPGNFVEVNCATIRADSAMSSLFGHKKGAFTGAVQARAGLLKTADQGMLFLDEIGELGPDEQAMLLHAIEEKTFLPVGADQHINSDFQLICGTNQDLQQAVAQGRFRQDLLARIDLWTFHLPGLRDRLEDIEPNLLYELERYAQKTGAHVTFNREAWNRFLQFSQSSQAQWTGNFRDLISTVTRMATLAPGGRITHPLVLEEIDRLKRSWGQPREKPHILARFMDAKQLSQLDRFERVQLADAVTVCTQSRTLSEAGRTLFSVSRNKKNNTNDADRLRKYLTRYGLTWKTIQTVYKHDFNPLIYTDLH
jgi:transcriptional regulatory protein RtcR